MRIVSAAVLWVLVAVHVGSANVACAIASEVADALVVGVDDDEIGFLGLGKRKRGRCGEGC